MKRFVFFGAVIVCLLVSAAFGAGTYDGGSGTAETPYQIATAGQLHELSLHSEDWDKCFVLTADIDMDPAVTGIAAYTDSLIGNYVNRDVPVPIDLNDNSSSDDIAFTGLFDGNGHSINNLIIENSTKDYIGLFGCIDGGTIKNLGIEDISLAGHSNVGSLCGRSYDSVISNCYVSGSVVGEHSIGGLCGSNCGIVRNSYSTGTVSGNSSVGGLVGNNYLDFHDTSISSIIANCYSTTLVNGTRYVGGLVGSNSDKITNCYSTGLVKGDVYLSGLVGWNSTDIPTGVAGVITDSYFYMYSGGKILRGIGLDQNQLKDKSSFFGFDFVEDTTDGNEDNWAIEPGFMPKLAWQIDLGFKSPLDACETTLSGTGCPIDPFIIDSYTDLMEFRNNPYLRAGNYSLTSDIDLAGTTFPDAFIPEVFYGSFAGNNHTISNLSVNGDSFLGFFSKLNGSVENLSLENVSIIGSGDYVGSLTGSSCEDVTGCNATGAVNGLEYVGGLVGENYSGNITRCNLAVTVTGTSYIGGLAGQKTSGNITCSSANGNVNGSWETGGLVGRNEGIIDKSFSTGEVKSIHENGDVGHSVGGLVGCNAGPISRCYSTSDVAGNPLKNRIGGLCGDNKANILNCYATGSVEGSAFVGGLCGDNNSSISNSYSTGKVIGNQFANGLVGWIYNYTIKPSVIINCFWDINTSGIDNPEENHDGGVGKTSEEMKALYTYTNAGWDFARESGYRLEDIWRLCEDGSGYPRLAWEFASGGDFVCGDGVDMNDFAYFAGRYGADVDIEQADLDGDGVVGILDLCIFGSHWLE